MLITKGNIKRIMVLALLLGSERAIVQAQDADTAVAQTTKVQTGVMVSGNVRDAARKKGASGVRVTVPGFSAAITDEAGNFSLRVPDYDAQLQVSSEGFQTRMVPLKGRKSVNISLNDETLESVYEPVTMPFGTQMKSETPASLGQYQTNGSWAQPFEMPDAQLQGRVSGLNAIRRSGTPGMGANMFLHGFNSLYGTNKPLIVIDNMIFDYEDYGESIIANNYTNPLALIDVKDIDNMTVLKDASSMYGTKGANGAIIITTARAKQQATKIDFGVYTGFNFAPKALPVMDATDYRTYLSEMLQSKGMSSADIANLPFMIDDEKHPEYYATHNNTNWQDKVMENSVNQNYFLKVTGGDNIATYALSMGYMQNQGVISNTDLNRYNTRFNAQLNFSQRFTGTANLAFTYNEQNLKDMGIAPTTNPIYLSLIKSPFFTDREVNESGAISPNLTDTDSLGVSNPVAVTDKMQAYNKYYRFFGSFGFKYDISKSLSASTLIGITYDKVRENVFIPRKGISDDSTANAVIDSRMGTQVKRLYTLYNDTRLSFARRWSRHQLSADLGVRFQNNQAEQDYALGYNSATDELVSVQNGVNALREVGGGIGDWNWINIYLHAEYNYRNRFFLSFNSAMDGSSRFGKEAEEGISIGGSPWAIMPSLGGAWLVSSEKFMANSGISFLKLRASIGKSGNDDIGNYSSGQYYVSQNLLGMQGLVRAGVSNPYLQWENVLRINAGLDLGFFNDRVQLSVDGWKSKTTKMLVYEPLQSPTGFMQVLTNGGSMETSGIDLGLNVRIINQPELRWDASVNVGTYKNKVLEVPNDAFVTSFAGATMITREGEAANQFYGLTTEGVYSTDAEAAADGLMKKMKDGSFAPFLGGDMRFTDRNGDNIIDDQDRTVIGNPNPEWFGGFNNRLGWKRLTLEAYFTFSAGGDVYNYMRHQLESAAGVENQLQSINNRWRSQGQVTSTPKSIWGDPMGNAAFSDRWIEDGSYLRLRTLSIGYHVPLKGQGFVKDMNVYAAGNNLLTFTKYLGYDPEFSANPSVFAQGVDTGFEPIYQSMTLGVKIGL